MSKLDTTLQNLPTIAKYALVASVVLFISTLFPNHNKFSYKYELGEVWENEDLFAPLDFGIQKSTNEIEEEKDQIKSKAIPIYKIDEQVIENRKDIFEKAFEAKIDIESETGIFEDVFQNTPTYQNFVDLILIKVYNRGIIQLDENHKRFSKEKKIKVGAGEFFEEKLISDFFTNREALKYTIEELFKSGLAEAEFVIPLLQESFFTPNVFYDDSQTIQYLSDELQSISTTKSTILKDALIISKGEIVEEEQFQQLQSLEAAQTSNGNSQKYSWSVFAGYFLLTSLIIGVFLFYLQFHTDDIFFKYSWLVFMLLWVAVYSYIVSSVESSDTLNAYMIPFCIAPIVVKTFFNEEVALFTHIVIILIASFLSSQGYEFTFLQLLAGIVAVLTPIETRDWSKFFYFLLTIFLAYVLGFLGLSLIKGASFSSMDWETYGWIFWSVFLTLLAYPLIPLLERIFGFTSSITLMELGDINRPLLKDLAEKAPGTFQHSLQVANLAEAAANKIGAKALLLKVGTLYHDIGKMKSPNTFIENQKGKNIHDDLAPEESAKIIIDHVAEGVKMAKKNRLPSVIIDFIKTHHGTTRVEYFYKKYQRLNPTQRVKEKDFKYLGPIPKSKEQTILLLADSIEAAAKSLKDPTEKSINDLVEKIVGNKIQRGQLANSELTFEELEICIKEFKRVLKGIYHARIQY